MRSDLVHSAGRSIENRFLLTTVACQIIRTLHIDSTRTEDTANQALSDISQERYIPVTLPKPVTPALTEPWLITPASYAIARRGYLSSDASHTARASK